ncbi:hypothetical protein H0H93_002333 [Arthromyces matolae]|nr:hypothetical protein H0H93_002333 [Arthromyces matolae]
MLKSSSLESLSIKTMIHPGNLLSNLTLPNLVNLSLNALHGTFSRETKIGLFKLLKTSKCSLITLSLIDVYPRESELVNCLRHNACATLQNLIIRSTISPLTKPTFRRRCITDGTINTLAATSSKHAGPAFCPKLKYLELSHCDTTEEVFVNMVKTRVGPGSFHLDYAFRSQGPDSEAVARKLAVFSTTHPLTFRSMLMQVITTDM